MASISGLTTLVCLFHHEGQAQAAVRDLLQAGVQQSSVSVLGGEGAAAGTSIVSSLAALGVPERDRKHLAEVVGDGGRIVAVSASAEQVGKVEDIFGSNHAKKIDESESDVAMAEPVTAEPAATVIPLIKEEMVVGKRAVDQGGVRVYRRVVEIPVDETVDLREEHVKVEHRAVERPATGEEMTFRERTIELTETAEEAVVGKTAHVVEEVVVGKEVSSHTEQVRDSVRHTEVELEEIVPGETFTGARR